MTKTQAQSTSKNLLKEKPELFTSPESSNVEGGSYYRKSKYAVIAFRDKKDPNAKTVYYYYEGMEPEHWEGLKTASSKGVYMSKVIKPKYTGVKL